MNHRSRESIPKESVQREPEKEKQSLIEEEEKRPSFFARHKTTIIIGIILVVLIGAGLLYWILRKKKKTKVSYEDLCQTFQQQLADYQNVLNDLKAQQSELTKE